MIAVEWLIIPVCHKQGLPERIQQRDFPDIRAGIMDEYARLHIAVGIDMAIVPSACNAAAYKLSIILEVHGIDWLAAFHCPDFPYPVVHVLSLLLRWKKFRRRIVSHRHIMEIPGKPAAFFYNQIDPRYYYGDIKEVMKENKITSVLFLYNGNTFVEDNSISGVLQNGETE